MIELLDPRLDSGLADAHEVARDLQRRSEALRLKCKILAELSFELREQALSLMAEYALVRDAARAKQTRPHAD